MHAERISSIELSTVVNRYPRTIGPNAQLGSHGSSGTDHVVTVRTDGGAEGWGVVRPIWDEHPFRSAGIDGVLGLQAELSRPDADGLERLVGRRLGDLFEADVGIIEPAALPLDFALHDLAGRVLGVPVYELLGARGPHAVRCYDGAIYFDDLYPTDPAPGIAAVLRNCAEDHASGHRAFKLKIGRGKRWMTAAEGLRRDIEVTRAVRDAYPDCELLVDANNGYSGASFLEYMRGVVDCDLVWVEEPFVEGERELASLRDYLAEADAHTLVADGEGSESDDERLVGLASEGLIQVIQFDVLQYGLSAWRRLMPRLERHGVLASPHTWGSPISTIYAAHVARGLGNVLSVEAVPATSGAGAVEYVLSDGVLSLSGAPGFGLSLPSADGQLRA